MAYQQTIINAMTEKERDRRIQELIDRGFEVVQLMTGEKSGNHWQDNGYRDRDGAKYIHRGSSSRSIFSAVMRRAIE